jgi:hypothetical protein
VGKLQRQYQHDTIDEPESGLGQSQVGICNRIEGAGEYTKPGGSRSGMMKELHADQAKKGFVGLITHFRQAFARPFW